MWKDNQGRNIRAQTTARVEYVGHDPAAVIISSNPALHVPNFDRCRRDRLCRCRACKPSLAMGAGTR